MKVKIAIISISIFNVLYYFTWKNHTHAHVCMVSTHVFGCNLQKKKKKSQKLKDVITHFQQHTPLLQQHEQ